MSGSSTINLGDGFSGRQGSQRDGIGGKSSNFCADSTTPDKYKDINIRLRRLLAEERRALQNVRTTYAAELRSRTDMEILFRQCVDDVRKEISRRTMPHPRCLLGGKPTFCGSPNSIIETPSRTSFTLGDRERTLELLLSQEKVITLLYAKTFPNNLNGRPRIGSLSSLDVSRGDNHEGVVDTDVLLAISMGQFDNSSAMQSGPTDEGDCEGSPGSEGGDDPIITASLLADTVYQFSGTESSKLPAI